MNYPLLRSSSAVSAILRATLLGLVLLVLTHLPAGAQTTYYWDGNGATTGAGTNAQNTGIWGGPSASPNWGTVANGTGPTTTTGPGALDTAVFTAYDGVAANNPTGVYTVTLGAAQSVMGIQIGSASFIGNNDGALTLAGTGSPGLTIGAGGVTLYGSTGDPTLAASIGTITLGADQTWNIFNAHVIADNAAMAGNATAGNTRTWTLGYVNAFTNTISGVISDGTSGGNLALTLNNTNGSATGLGTWSITGVANTFTGKTTIAQGNLQIASIKNVGGGASSLGAVTTVDNGTIDFGSGGLSGTLTYIGTTASTTNRVIHLVGTTGGAIIRNNSSAAANTLTFTSDLANDGGGLKTFTLGGSNTGANTFSGAIGDAIDTFGLAVAKVDAGQWILSGNNSFTGGLTVSAGTLNLTSATTFAGGIKVNGGTLSVSASGNLGTNDAGNSISIAGGNPLLGGDGNVGSNQSITISAAGGGVGVAYTPSGSFPTITAPAGAPIVFGINYVGTGGIAGTGGAGNTAIPGVDALFTPTSTTFLGTYRLGGGGGTLTIANAILTGANNLLVGGAGGGTVILPNGNTYTGTTTIQLGTLTAPSLNRVVGGTASSALGAPTTVANGTITIGSGTNIAGLNYSGAGETTDRVLNITGSGGTSILQNSGTGAVVFSSNPTFTETAAKTLQLGAANDSLGGSIGAVTDSTAATAKTSLTKLGLSNSLWSIGASTYTGNTVINGGVLQTADVLANSPFINLAGIDTAHNAVIQTSGTFARNTGNGVVAGQSIVAVGANSGFSARGGKLTVTLNSNGLLSYGTGNFVGAGGSALVFGSTTSDNQVEFTNPINLNTTDAFARNIFVERGLGGDSALLSGVISNLAGSTTAATGITKQGRGTLILSNQNTFSGLVTASAGALVAQNNSTGTVSGAFGTGTGPSGAPTASSAIVMGDGATGSGGNPALQTGGAFTVDRRITVNDSGTNNVYSVGGITDNNSTFSGLITDNAGAAIANNNTFAITQVATTGTNALNITGGITGAANASAKTINFSNVGAVNVSGVAISNGGAGVVSVAKNNTGAVSFNVANTYTGNTTITNGALYVNAAVVSPTTSVTGGVLGGNGGTFNAISVTGAGRIDPGFNGTGVHFGTVNSATSITPNLTATNLTLSSSATYVLDLGAPTAFTTAGGMTIGQSSFLLLSGNFSPGGASLQINDNGAALSVNEVFKFIQYAGNYDGTLFNVASAAGNTYSINYAAGDPFVELTVTALAVPEPGTWAMLLTGVGSLVALQRVRRRKS